MQVGDEVIFYNGSSKMKGRIVDMYDLEPEFETTTKKPGRHYLIRSESGSIHEGREERIICVVHEEIN